jgi:hypothetical protein
MSTKTKTHKPTTLDFIIAPGCKEKDNKEKTVKVLWSATLILWDIGSSAEQ